MRMKFYIYKVKWFSDVDFEEYDEEGIIVGESLGDVATEIGCWGLDLIEMVVRPLVTNAEYESDAASECLSICFEDLACQAREANIRLSWSQPSAGKGFVTKKIENSIEEPELCAGDCCNDK